MIVAIVLILAAGLTAILEGPDSNAPPAGVTISVPTQPTFTEPSPTVVPPATPPQVPPPQTRPAQPSR